MAWTNPWRQPAALNRVRAGFILGADPAVSLRAADPANRERVGATVSSNPDDTSAEDAGETTSDAEGGASTDAQDASTDAGDGTTGTEAVTPATDNTTDAGGGGETEDTTSGTETTDTETGSVEPGGDGPPGPGDGGGGPPSGGDGPANGGNGGNGGSGDGGGGTAVAGTAVTTVEPGRRAPWWGSFALGVVILLLGATLLYSLIQVWPAAQAGKAPAKLAASTKITWFGRHYAPTPESALLLIVVLAGALGAFLHVATSFSDYVGNRRLMRSWTWFYVLRPLVGASLAVIFYFAILGGLFTSQGTSALNPYGIAALSALVGLFSKQATNKLQQIFDTAFAVAKGEGDDARADSIGNPKPTIVGVSPPQLKRGGDVTLTLSGTGFIQASVVSVARPDGTDVPRTAVLNDDAKTLTVTLEPEDTQNADTLVFTVINPAPGGGTSAPATVNVVDLETNGSTGGGE
jgi:hypothetical protein